MMLASMAEREHLRTSILLVQNYKIILIFPRNFPKTVKKKRFFLLNTKIQRHKESQRGKGLPSLERRGWGWLISYP
jgi:hypothetical protein